MEPLLKSFSLGFLLRSVFAGAFFVIAYQIAAEGTQAVLHIDSPGLLAAAFPISLFSGVIIYGLHRALLYPFVEYVFHTSAGKKTREQFPLISNATVDALLDIWGMGAEVDKKTQEYARKTSEWADFTHLHYASALCIGAGAAARVIIVPGNYRPYWPLILLFFVLLVAGLVSDWRLKRVRERILK